MIRLCIIVIIIYIILVGSNYCNELKMKCCCKNLEHYKNEFEYINECKCLEYYKPYYARRFGYF